MILFENLAVINRLLLKANFRIPERKPRRLEKRIPTPRRSRRLRPENLFVARRAPRRLTVPERGAKADTGTIHRCPSRNHAESTGGTAFLAASLPLRRDFFSGLLLREDRALRYRRSPTRKSQVHCRPH